MGMNNVLKSDYSTRAVRERIILKRFKQITRFIIILIYNNIIILKTCKYEFYELPKKSIKDIANIT